MADNPAKTPSDGDWWQVQSDLYFGDDFPDELTFGGRATLGYFLFECARRMSASGKLNSWCERMARHLYAIVSLIILREEFVKQGGVQ